MKALLIKQVESREEINGMGLVLCQGWHETYTGLVDRDFLNQITVEKGVNRAEAQKEHALISIMGDRVIGLVSFGPYRNEDAQDDSKVGEIYAIYVLAQFHGKKVGYQLMNAALDRMSGYDKIVLWVLQGNEKAIRFYERYGFQLDGKEKQIVLGTEQTELRMTLRGPRSPY